MTRTFTPPTAVGAFSEYPISGLRRWRVATITGTLDNTLGLAAARARYTINARGLTLFVGDSPTVAAGATATFSAYIGYGSGGVCECGLPELTVDGGDFECPGTITLAKNGGDANTVLSISSFTLTLAQSLRESGAKGARTRE